MWRAEGGLGALGPVVTTEVGDWKALHAGLCGWIPEARAQFELANRQAAFRAMSNIKGVTADAMLSVTLIHPGSANSDWLDRAGITGLCRLKRLRPGTPMGFLHGSSIAPPPGTQRLSLDAEPIDPQHGAPLLKNFSTSPTPAFDVRVDGDIVHYLLKGDGVGLGSLVDLHFADVMRGRYPVDNSISPLPATPGAVVDVPVKTPIVDVLVHEALWPEVEPGLLILSNSSLICLLTFAFYLFVHAIKYHKTNQKSNHSLKCLAHSSTLWVASPPPIHSAVSSTPALPHSLIH